MYNMLNFSETTQIMAAIHNDEARFDRKRYETFNNIDVTTNPRMPLVC